MLMGRSIENLKAATTGTSTPSTWSYRQRFFSPPSLFKLIHSIPSPGSLRPNAKLENCRWQAGRHGWMLRWRSNDPPYPTSFSESEELTSPAAMIICKQIQLFTKVRVIPLRGQHCLTVDRQGFWSSESPQSRMSSYVSYYWKNLYHPWTWVLNWHFMP